MKIFLYLFLYIILPASLFAQGVPIGNWQTFYTYNTATSVAVDGSNIYSGKYGLQCYNKKTNEYTQYTKVNGLSDINISKLAFNQTNSSLVICYESSNIDIYQNGIFYNVPDVKNANIIASKKISNIECIGDDAYLSTGFGIVVVDLKKHEIKATYPMVIAGEQAIVYDVALHQDSILALTSKGIFAADVNNNFLQNIETWRLVNTNVYKTIEINNNDYFIANDTVLFNWNGGNIIQKIFENNANITDVFYANDTIYVSTFLNDGSLVKMNRTGLLYGTKVGVSPLSMAIDGDNTIWLANIYGGLSSVEGDIQKKFKIPGPFSNDAFNIRFINNGLYICAGYVNPQYIFGINRGGLNRLKNNEWATINQYNYYPQMDSIVDIIDAEEDRITGSIYMASYGGGFIEIDKKGKFTQLARNSVIGSSANGNYAWLVTNLKMDNNNNLWVTVSNADNNLLCKKKDGTWKSFSIPTTGDTKVMAQIEIDNIGQKWIVMPRNRGLMVFNDNNTIDNSSDDRYNTYLTAVGKGNLASNNVRCIAIDKDSKIWVGTDNGISIINCPEQALEPGNCDAENKIVQYDIAAGKLFQDEYITTIAVDGANRKWIGTYNGAWLISADAEKIIGRFTIDNSPLPSNEITKIDIDRVLGDVYFATASGVVSYRYTATDGATELLEPLVYPNPVASDYKGTIAISGLVENADVRITDVAGQLVYRTKALGGQAIWDGNTYTGYRPQSGVYYVLATSADGGLTQKTKFIFMH
jgi:ligand-binding sensor domain-containing protein